MLAVTRPITAPTLAITVQTNQASLTITGETNRTYTVLSSTNLLNWRPSGEFRQQQLRLAMDRARDQRHPLLPRPRAITQIP